MSGWLIHRLSKQVAKLKNYLKCERCHLYIHKDLKKCNYCSHLSDSELALMITKKSRFRVSLGKAMFFAAVLFFGFMILLGKLL
jgi:recombinational DNA repair protein RecR